MSTTSIFPSEIIHRIISYLPPQQWLSLGGMSSILDKGGRPEQYIPLDLKTLVSMSGKSPSALFVHAVMKKNYSLLRQLLDNITTDLETRELLFYWTIHNDDMTAYEILVEYQQFDEKENADIITLWQSRLAMKPEWKSYRLEQEVYPPASSQGRVSCMQRTVKKRSLRMVRLVLRLISHVEYNVRDCMKLACEVGRADVVSMLLKEKHDSLVEFIDIARRHGNHDIVGLLLKSK